MSKDGARIDRSEIGMSRTLPDQGASDSPSDASPGAVQEPLPAPPPDADDPDADDPEQTKRRYLTHRFRMAARGFWGRNGDRLAWPLSFAVLAIILINLGLQYGINVWNRVIFDALEARDSSTVFFLSAIFIPLAVASVCCGAANVYGRMTLQRRWRAWLSRQVIERWLYNGRYFQLNLVSGDHDNPEYRIAQDLRVATDAPVDFVVGVVSAALSAATFITVLWTIGGALSFHVAGIAVTIPGSRQPVAVDLREIVCAFANRPRFRAYRRPRRGHQEAPLLPAIGRTCGSSRWSRQCATGPRQITRPPSCRPGSPMAGCRASGRGRGLTA